MKINNIKINSYGKLKEKEIKLKDVINILYGKNEAGKSTLLRFIINSFYGISKNKKGKEYSDYEKYLPWSGEDFSGKIEYELDNKNKYEIYRDFKKKNPQIFNEKMEDISKEFNIDKNKGNEFFYEQTKVDEDLFLSTVVVSQQEVKLEKNQQNMLIQKIANLVGTGEDNVSYKRALDRINRRQLDEVGTERSREKPINIVSRKINELENEQIELEKYGDIKYEIEDKKNDLKRVIIDLENENDFLKEINLVDEKEDSLVGIKRFGQLFPTYFLYRVVVALAGIVVGVIGMLLMYTMITDAQFSNLSQLVLMNVNKSTISQDEIVNIVASLSNVFSFVFILVIIISILSVYLSLKFGLFNYILQKYNYTGLTALKESSRLMKGNKWTLFKLEFSFFGWMILAGLVSGVVAMFVETIMPIPFLATFITGVVSTFFSAYFYDVKLNTCFAVFYEELDYADKNSVEL